MTHLLPDVVTNRLHIIISINTTIISPQILIHFEQEPSPPLLPSSFVFELPSSFDFLKITERIPRKNVTSETNFLLSQNTTIKETRSFTHKPERQITQNCITFLRSKKKIACFFVAGYLSTSHTKPEHILNFLKYRPTSRRVVFYRFVVRCCATLFQHRHAICSSE